MATTLGAFSGLPANETFSTRSMRSSGERERTPILVVANHNARITLDLQPPQSPARKGVHYLLGKLGKICASSPFNGCLSIRTDRQTDRLREHAGQMPDVLGVTGYLATLGT
jgi:hypothetical protein